MTTLETIPTEVLRNSLSAWIDANPVLPASLPPVVAATIAILAARDE